MKWKVGMNVTVSCKELYEKCKDSHGFEIQTEKNESGEDAYWDLYNADGELACMDGETCEIVSIQDGYITLQNNDGESEKLFTLSAEEANIGLFVNP